MEFFKKDTFTLCPFLSLPIGKFCFVVLPFVGGFPLNTRVIKEPEGHSNLACILGRLALFFHSLVVCWEQFPWP